MALPDQTGGGGGVLEGMLPKTQLISLENKTVHFIAPLRVVNKKTCLKDPVDLFTEKMKKKKKRPAFDD